MSIPVSNDTINARKVIIRASSSIKFPAGGTTSAVGYERGESFVKEKKLVLVFFGSPHRHGHTAHLLRAFLQPFHDRRQYEIRIISAYDEDIAPCRACGFCQRTEACSIHDMDQIDSMIRRAELLVFATPVYNLTFPAPPKAIVDRFQRYFEARFALGLRPPIEKPKKAALLMTLGSKDMFGAEVVEKQLRMAFSVMNTQLEEVVAWPGTDRPEGKEQLNAMFEQAHLSALAIKEKV